jgi:hypothetical protein
MTPGSGSRAATALAKRVRDQLGAQVVHEGVADDAGGDVDDRRELEPAFPGGG